MAVNSYDAMDGLQVIVDEFERFIKFVEEQKPKLSSKKLHQAIQEAFKFDDDHPYLFCFGSSSIQDGTCIYSYLSDGHKFTTLDYAIGDLGLVKGQRFYYLYDFGDSVWIEIYVTGIDKDSPLPSDYEIIAQNKNKQ